ncbi:hypothetical protein CONCODRAFT_14234 [Conidiobolus coronatus NRRL 28638]|uniref:Galactose oxidase n=1 Tax=Conidiobolus coronatus (strain ATCC 28846 / CBS 209.66 / NRRL 28638) TaxID=796925 RepID=A0A137NPE1_CONC2|nr:hypothetical protein CONCODRAFT_14234 [Conidiobolus coronatus NRRL 28638]|eukprot:KXN64601.1 hypothetical protein CONCODRAFT_14234 [Conidiobolus coronatus NRRL 28638]
MWTGQFLNNSDIKFDGGFIKKPDFENFPKGGFSQDIVVINDKPVMYIIGGFIYSQEKKYNIITSSVFRYDFSSNSWSDLSESSNSILPPIADHQTVVVDNFILVTNGLSPNLTTTKYPQTAPYNSSTSIFNYYDKAFKFDILSQKWSSITIKTNTDSSIYRRGHIMSHMHGASLNLYKGSLVAYTLLFNLKTNIHDPHLGILNYYNWEWSWYRVNTDTGIDNNLQLAFHQSIIIKDQLLLIHGFTNQNTWKKLYVINLPERKLSPVLSFSESSGTGTSLPVYLIATIVLVVIVVLLSIGIAYFQFVYKKRTKQQKDNKPMTEVWAAEVVDLNTHKSMKDNNKLVNNTLTSDSIIKTNLSQIEIIENDASDISGLECFQYNSDFIDMEDTDQIKSPLENDNHYKF